MGDKIIVTGFSPWGEHERNTSWECLHGLSWWAPSGIAVEKRLLPVGWNEVEEAAREIVASRPLAIVSFGQYDGDRIRLERRARPRFSCSRPDCRGAVYSGLSGNGQPDFHSTLPLDAASAALEAASIPRCISEDAGDYLCNFLFYRLLYECHRQNLRLPAGFIHVPQSGRMADSQIEQAIQITVDAMLRAWYPA